VKTGTPIWEALRLCPKGVYLKRDFRWYEVLSRQREALFAEVLAADPATAADRRIEHPMFGPLSWRETLLFTRLHDLDHAGQLQKIAAALGAAHPA
jgi:hypothetical protein